MYNSIMAAAETPAVRIEVSVGANEILCAHTFIIRVRRTSSAQMERTHGVQDRRVVTQTAAGLYPERYIIIRIDNIVQIEIRPAVVDSLFPAAFGYTALVTMLRYVLLSDKYFLFLI